MQGLKANMSRLVFILSHLEILAPHPCYPLQLLIPLRRGLRLGATLDCLERILLRSYFLRKILLRNSSSPRRFLVRDFSTRLTPDTYELSSPYIYNPNRHFLKFFSNNVYGHLGLLSMFLDEHRRCHS